MATNLSDASISKNYAYAITTITSHSYDATITKLYNFTSSVNNSSSVNNTLTSKTY